jgi:hypothetical protein
MLSTIHFQIKWELKNTDMAEMLPIRFGVSELQQQLISA